MNKSTCKSCGASIIWCKTEKGANAPIDAEPSADGNIVIIDGIAKHSNFLFGDLPKYKNHFATCKHAALHRKDKGA